MRRHLDLIESHMGLDDQPIATSNFLESFTDYCIASAETKKGLDSEYVASSILDQFMQIMTYLYKGYVVLLNLQMFEDDAPNYWPDYVPDRGVSDKTAEEKTVDLIDILAKKVLGPLSEIFQQCTIRFLLSQYNPEVEGLFPEFIPQESLEKICREMSLASWLVSKVDPIINPIQGQVISSYSKLRMNDLKLKPEGDFPESIGTPLTFPEKYHGILMPYFYKCIDYVESQRGVGLVPFELSDIQVQKYAWEYVGDRPANGKVLTIDGCSGSLKMNWFNTSTLAIVEQPQNTDDDDLIWFGHFVDAEAFIGP